MRAGTTRLVSLGGLVAALPFFLSAHHHSTPTQPAAAGAADVALAPAPRQPQPTLPAPTTTTTRPPVRVTPPPTYAHRAPAPASVSRAQVVISGGWNSTFQCVIDRESGGNWSENTGNGYYGAAQWLPSTWNSAARGAGYNNYANGRPDLDPAGVQMAVMVYWQHAAGWGQWPNTSRACGV